MGICFKPGMKLGADFLEGWSEVRCHLPADFDLAVTARARGAFVRARGVGDAETLLRLALGYGACGMSLRETCAWASAGGIATLSDTALLERLEKAADWLGDLVGALLAEVAPAAAPSGSWPGWRLRAVDATALCAPGANGTSWRLHVGYDLARQRVDRIDLTDGRGAESLRRFAGGPGDILLADRGYARPRDLRPLLEAGADLIVRTGWNALRLLRPSGRPFDLFAALAAQRGPVGEVRVCVDEGATPGAGTSLPQTVPLRLVIGRKTAEATARTRQRLLKESRQKGKRPDPRSLQAAEYILLLTSLPAETFSSAQVLALYRLRWQIELAFKRMKSLAGLDTLPAKKPALARAWIHARLIALLLADRIAGQVPDPPPSAPRQPRAAALRAHHTAQPLKVAPHEARLDQHPGRHPRAMPVAAPLPSH